MLTPSTRNGRLRRLTQVLAVGALAGAALAHDDDPKIVHKKAPVPGSGFARGLAAGQPLPGGGLEAFLTPNQLERYRSRGGK